MIDSQRSASSGDSSSGPSPLVAPLAFSPRWFLWHAATPVVSLGVVAILMRLIDPREFGLLAVSLPLVMILRTFGTLGLSVAAIQSPKLDEASRSGLYWRNLRDGLLTTVVIAACGPLVAWYSREPLAATLTYALSATAFAAALGSVPLALLERELAIRTAAAVRVASQLAAGVLSIAVAAAGWGVWALVVQQYAELLLLAAGSMVASGFRPISPTRSRFGGKLARLGGEFAWANLLLNLAQQVDRVVLAGCLSATGEGRIALGLFSQSLALIQRPISFVSTPVTGVLLPVMSRSQEHLQRFNRLAVYGYRLTAMLLWPVAVAIYFAAPDLPLVLGGEKWRNAEPLLQALSPLAAGWGLIHFSGYMLLAKGGSRGLFWGAAVTLLLAIQACVAGVFLGRRFGLTELGIAQSLGYFQSLTLLVILTGPYAWFAARLCGVPFASIASAVRRPLVAAMLLAVCLSLALPQIRSSFPERPLIPLLAAAGLTLVTHALLAGRDLAALFRGRTEIPA